MEETLTKASKEAVSVVSSEFVNVRDGTQNRFNVSKADMATLDNFVKSVQNESKMLIK